VKGSVRVLVVLLVVYGLVAGTAAGAVAARLAGFPGSPPVVPAADLPRATDSVVHGVTSGGVQQALTKAGFACAAGADTQIGTIVMTCRDGRTAGYAISVDIDSAPGGSVTSVVGRCQRSGGGTALDVCAPFIHGVPGLLYPGDAARAAAAQDWVSHNLGADTSTEIQGIYYALQLEPLLIVCMPAA
jgi:hypothetical protein